MYRLKNLYHKMVIHLIGLAEINAKKTKPNPGNYTPLYILAKILD